MHTVFRSVLLALLTLSFATQVAHASNDRVAFGKDIVISEGESAGSIVCILCSVKLQGNAGDIVTILGSVTTEGSREISGDMVTLGGDVSLTDNSSLRGDIVVVGGDLNLSSDASIHGDREIFPGRAWLFLPFAPLLILIGVVWLAIWLVRRNQYRFPMYPYGRGL
jgi:hypothetical protein